MAPMKGMEGPRAPRLTVFRGTLVHTPVYGSIEVMHDRVLVVKDGKIDKIVPGEAMAAVLDSYDIPAGAVRRLAEGEFLMPGLIDTHIHAPQYKFAGTGTDLPLMEWLQKYTFPIESSHSDPEHSLYRYGRVVRRLLANGTTTATYYGSLHLQPNKVLVDEIVRLGQRAVVGKVNMDRESPDHYVESFEQGLKEAEEFVQYAQAKQCSRLYPCITPRFIPTCTIEMMKALAGLARKYNVHVQSHISECCGEVAFVKHLHPEYATDAAVFDSVGLLDAGRKTLMAHGTLLSDEDIKFLVSKNVGIAHCPLSNFFVGDAFFKVNHAMKLGLKVGLGTDVAGGYSPSMFMAIRMAVVNGRCLRAHKLAVKGGLEVTPDMETDVLTYKEGLYLATMGGAQALGIEDQVGSFEVGKEFDALLIKPEVPNGPFDVFYCDSFDERLEKFINLGDDRNIAEVWVAGAQVREGDNFTGDFPFMVKQPMPKSSSKVDVAATAVN